MAIRLNFIVEGQTEETFVNTILKPHLEPFSIWVSARCVETSRKLSIKHRGGITRYAVAKRDIQQWLRNDRNSDARFTTMFDLCRLPDDFPGYADASVMHNPYHRVAALEDALADDVADYRFIPYLQLHEFEALLLADPQQLDTQFPGYDDAICSLTAAVSQCGSPEFGRWRPEHRPVEAHYRWNTGIRRPETFRRPNFSQSDWVANFTVGMRAFRRMALQNGSLAADL